MPSTRSVGPGDPGDHLDDTRPDRAHREAVRALLAQYTIWMRARCRLAAVQYDLDPDDVFQQTLVRLLRSSRTADLTDDGLLTWLGQGIDWTARDLVRKRGHDGGQRLGDEVIIAILEAVPPESDDCGQGQVDASLLRRTGLTESQVQLLQIVCSGLDLPLRVIAHQVGRSYTAVRKDKQRAVEQLERWLALDPEERRVLIAFRETRSVSEGARQTGHTPSGFRILLDAASRKVNDAFTESEADSDVT